MPFSNGTISLTNTFDEWRIRTNEVITYLQGVITNGVAAGAGSASTPSIAVGTTNKGLYDAGSNQLGLAAGGVPSLLVHSNYAALMSNTAEIRLGSASDAIIARDDADALSIRRSTTPQSFRVHNTYTDATNFERVSMRFVSNVAYIGQEASGSGSVRELILGHAGAPLRLRSSMGAPASPANNDVWIEASGASPTRRIKLMVYDLGQLWELAAITV